MLYYERKVSVLIICNIYQSIFKNNVIDQNVQKKGMPEKCRKNNKKKNNKDNKHHKNNSDGPLISCRTDGDKNRKTCS